jgi:hypothetical protein
MDSAKQAANKVSEAASQVGVLERWQQAAYSCLYFQGGTVLLFSIPTEPMNMLAGLWLRTTPASTSSSTARLCCCDTPSFIGL